MKKTILTFALLFISLFSFAHLGSLVGVVFDQATNLPLKGVNVQLTGTGKATATNELGQYRFDNLVAAPYKVEFSYIGYKSVIEAIIVEEDKNTSLKTLMQTSSVELDEVVVSSGRPNDQQLISSLDIKLRPIQNSQEILRIVPGLFIGQHAGGGKAEQLFLRGFDIDHGTDVQISVDGMPVNMVSHAHGQGYADLHFVIPELVQGVDFKKGSYNAQKGNFTTAGWIDFRTRDALDRSFVKFEAGQFDSFRSVIGLDLLGQKGKDKNQSAFVASEYSFTNSYFDNPQHFNRFNIFGKYHGHIGKSTYLTFSASSFYSKWNHSGQIPDRAVASGETGFFGSLDPTEGGETSRTNATLQFTTATARNHVFKNKFYYSNYNFKLFSNFTFFLIDSVNGDQIKQQEGRNLFGYSGDYSFQNYVGRSSWTTTFGLQYRHDITQNTELSRTLNRTEVLEQIKLGNINETNLGIFADETIRLSDHFSVNTGVRLDYFINQYQDLLTASPETKRIKTAIISPKLNFYYTFNKSTQLYFNTGKGFHSNDTRVVVAQAGRDVLPPTYGSDLGIIFKPLPKLIVNTAAWYLWLKQEFVYVGDAGVVEPSGRTRRYGIDMSARYQFSKYFYADLDINTAKPYAVDGGEGQHYIPLAPTFTTTGGLSLQGLKGFSGSLRYRYIANRAANEDNSITAKGYFVTDFQANYSGKNYTVSLSIQNLLNSRWKETQFATESKLKTESVPVTEIHFTPGTPFFGKLGFTFFF